jgi:hypothetical protein
VYFFRFTFRETAIYLAFSFIVLTIICLAGGTSKAAQGTQKPQLVTEWQAGYNHCFLHKVTWNGVNQGIILCNNGSNSSITVTTMGLK